ncbi:MAG TPA: RluA family pseudouridine synthase [Paucimonas sp.]|nr:RluA family pseudouridine synthase [Paucimonas sp.]
MSSDSPLPAPNRLLAETDAEIDDLEEGEGGPLAGPGEPIELVLDAGFCGERLDKTLSRLLPQYSRSRLQQWIESGHVTVEGQAAKGKMTMLGDERICVIPQAAPEDHAFTPEPMELPVVHEDAAIIVIDKPVGMVVHPAAGNWSGTLLNGLLHRYPALAGVPRAGIVHRLDKDTSGLMVVARTLEAQTDLVRQLQARSVKREYLALVWGTPLMSGTVDAAIGRHPRERIKMAVSEQMSAKPAVTHYHRLAAGSLDGKPVSLMKCRLETGRTHQIRVHLQSIGFPLVGDGLYGKTHLASAFPRQALHAYRLGLVHPTSGKQGEWSAPLPADMAELLARSGIPSTALDQA